MRVAVISDMHGNDLAFETVEAECTGTILPSKL